ncbi:hypothetical protein LAZ67_11002127 [Cordylochernes scorpioides]|uniref:Transposase n=1 Tax=Cordylochernes scorpioides TaxID=51811 RepID=A0ABY6L2V0_9ARAC|nr:hypothetical protein LAZ67_11002127 [Cordylochernes scorpioides]
MSSKKDLKTLQKEEVVTGAKIGISIKEILPIFNPDTGLTYQEWRNIFERIVKFQSISEKDALSMIPSIFKGKALEIYVSMCQDVFTLDELHQAKNTFFPVSTSGLMKQFWTEKKLPSQLLMDYYFNKLKLAKILNISSEQTLEALSSNVNAKLRPFLIAANPANLDMWIKIASSLEEEFRHEETSSPFNGPRYRRDFQNIDSRNATPSQDSLPSGARPGREVGDRQETRREQFYQDFRATETFEMLNKAFPNDAPKRTTVFEWHSKFKASRISIEDDPRQGRPKFRRTDENVQKFTDLIKENPRTTLLELEQDTGISKTTIGRIVTEDLKLKKTPAKFIPRFLTNEQKLCRLATCEDMMEMTRTDPEWKDKLITGDETWVYGYDPETKPQTAEWRDIAPNDLFLFPKLKAILKGRHFDTRDDIIEKSPLALKSIPKEAYKNCFDNWEKRWRCYDSSADGWAEAMEHQDTTNDPTFFTKVERKRRRTSASHRAPTAQSGTIAPIQRSTYVTRGGFSARCQGDQGDAKEHCRSKGTIGHEHHGSVHLRRALP